MKRTRITGFAALMFAAVLGAFSAVNSNAATFVVNTTNDTQDALPGDGSCADATPQCSLRAAITEANFDPTTADIITLPAGTYTESLVAASEDANVGGDFDIRSDVIINGGGSGTTFVEANAVPGVATERVFHILGVAAASVLNVNINNLTVRNGGTGANLLSGGGIRLGQSTNSTYTFDNLIVTENRNATVGGGIAINAPTTPIAINITNSTISNNTAGSALAGSDNRGAGIYQASAGPINITNTIITGNVSTPGITAQNALGGGVYTQAGTTTFTNSTISNNTARVIAAGFTGGASGGGICVLGGNIVFNTSTLSNNTASVSTGGAGSANGGGVYTQAGVNIFTTSTISDNTASTTLAGSTGNSTGGGVAVFGGTVTLTGTSVISGNLSTSSGGTGSGFAGGIYQQNSTLNVTTSTVTNNMASHSRGGIYTIAGASVTTTNITNSTVSGNTANGTSGGGVTNVATSTGNSTTNITGSTINGNRVLGAGGFAGGLLNQANTGIAGLCVMNVTNSTVSGNTAPFAAGGYNNAATATINYNYATIAANTAITTGGGLYQDTTGVTNIKNTVVADNTAPTGPDIFGTITSQNYNHVENPVDGTFLIGNGNNKGLKNTVAEGFFALPNDVTGTDPGLAALANNGGPTQTHLQSFSSPLTDAIPVGTSDCGVLITTDQRNTVRPTSVACDKGATELTSNAANASISGRVITAGGNGIRSVILSVTGGSLTVPIYVRTGSFGYFSFENLPAGETYVITIHSKRYVFDNPSRLISLSDSVSDVDFTASSQ